MAPTYHVRLNWGTDLLMKLAPMPFSAIAPVGTGIVLSSSLSGAIRKPLILI